MARQPGSRIRDFDQQPAANPRGPSHVNPHTPWQILIEDTRGSSMSIRDLAAKAKIPDATLYNWLRAKRGSPTAANYSASINRRLASALGLDPAVLADAYNRSQPTLDPDAPDEAPRAPAPQPSGNLPGTQVDGLKRFLAMLDASGAQTFTLDQIKAFAAVILPPE